MLPPVPKPRVLFSTCEALQKQERPAFPPGVGFRFAALWLLLARDHERDDERVDDERLDECETDDHRETDRAGCAGVARDAFARRGDRPRLADGARCCCDTENERC